MHKQPERIRINPAEIITIANFLTNYEYWPWSESEFDKLRNGGTPALMKAILKCLRKTGIKVIALYGIIHHRDRNPFGKKIEPHLFIVMRLDKKNKLKPYEIADKIGISPYIIEAGKSGSYSFINSLSYLIRCKDANIPYDPSEVFTALGEDFMIIEARMRSKWAEGRAIKSAKVKGIDKVKQLLLAGNITLSDVKEKYPMEYINHKDKCIRANEFYLEMKMEREVQSLLNGDFERKSLFIVGKSDKLLTDFIKDIISILKNISRKFYNREWNNRLSEVERKIRTDSVVGMRTILQIGGKDNPADISVNDLQDVGLQFLREQYGEKNIIAFGIDCDQCTFHIHSLITPIHDKINKKGRKITALDAKNLFTPDTIREMHKAWKRKVDDSFDFEVEHELKPKRGKKTVKEYQEDKRQEQALFDSMKKVNEDITAINEREKIVTKEATLIRDNFGRLSEKEEELNKREITVTNREQSISNRESELENEKIKFRQSAIEYVRTYKTKTKEVETIKDKLKNIIFQVADKNGEVNRLLASLRAFIHLMSNRERENIEEAETTVSNISDVVADALETFERVNNHNLNVEFDRQHEFG